MLPTVLTAENLPTQSEQEEILARKGLWVWWGGENKPAVQGDGYCRRGKWQHREGNLTQISGHQWLLGGSN